MANSSAFGKVSGYRSAFWQTCNLLSQYVKEKKSIGDLSLGMFGNGDERGQNDMFHPTMMNFFPTKNNPEEPKMSNGQSISLFPQQAGFAAASSEIQSSQMTIFYAGQVIVFNDFPAHKAKEIMELAGQGIPQNPSTNNIPAVTHANTINPDTNNKVSAMKNMVDVATLAPPSPNIFATSGNTSHQIQECAQQPTTPIITDLPIARKASLHRFLEKRKDRIKAKAPYNTSKPGDMPLKPNESNSWLGLAAAARPSSLHARD